MNLNDVKNKLEFNKVIEKIKTYCYSDLGIRKTENIEFITDENDLNAELDKTEEMRRIIDLDTYLDLTGLKDIGELLSNSKIEGSHIPQDKFLWILDFLRLSRNIKTYFKRKTTQETAKLKILSGIASELFADNTLEHHIVYTIDENGNVKDTASAELKKIRNEINQKSETLRKLLQRILKNLSESEFSRDDIVTLRDGRSVIPVKIENKRKVPGIIHSTSASGITVYIEPGETIELNNEITELSFKEKREIEKILTELTKEISVNYEKLKRNCEILGELDYLQAKARYSVVLISSRPEFSDKETELVNAYHPLLLQGLERKNIIPLNLNIGKNFNTLVITGPNAGGKTVALKTIGLLQLMFQSGILIPCESHSKMRIFNKIFVNIGDEQSIENNLSSFSSHLKILKKILQETDNRSLILIDEICAGTDPNFGSALSAGILKYLSEKNSITIVTTHTGNLKSFAYNTPNIENASLEFDMSSLSPNFHFVTGIPGQSFTFEIADKFAFPPELMNFARSLINVSDDNLENLIKDLNAQKQKYKELKDKNDKNSKRLEGLLKMYEEKVKEIKQKEKNIIKNANDEASEILKQANKIIEKTIKEIKESGKLSPKQIKADFKKESEKILKSEEAATVRIYEFHTDDLARHKDLQMTGKIMEIKKDKIIIEINGIPMKVNPADIEPADNAEMEKYRNYDTVTTIKNKIIETKLDIRGKYPEEIKDLVEEFIINAVNEGIKEISIIHGKGTGKLRSEVRKIISKNNLIKSYRYGNWNEGDTGVTIIEL
ncbi:MAG: endonuclease MutS2 [Ignavibacteria bacterium]|nr:endonuclease MutS2 [Ignavibacteria bacterium]